MKRIFSLIGLFLFLGISALPYQALSGACPGDEDETELEVGDTLEGRLGRDDVEWYTFEAEAGDIWRIDMLGDSSDLFRVGVLDPETRRNEDFTNDDLYFNYLIGDEQFISAFRTQMDGIYCLLLRNEDTPTINYEVSLEPFPRDNADELEDIDELDAFGRNTVGIWYYVQERYELALDAFAASLELEDEDYVVQLNACTTAYLLGEYEDAIDFCDESIDLVDDYPDSLLYRAYSLQSMGEYEDAADDFDAVLDIQDDVANDYFDRSINSMLKGDFDDALDDMEEYTDLGNIDNPYWLALAQLYAGELEDAQDTFEDSAAAFEDEGTDPTYPNIWLGVIADLNGERQSHIDNFWEDALDAAQALSPLEEKRAQALVALLQDDMDTAQAYYEEILAEQGLPHERVYDLLYLRLLNELYPNNLTFFTLLDWFEGELGL